MIAIDTALAYPCKIADLPAEVYHARPEWSTSQLKLLPDSPELFCGYHITREWEFKQTDDMWLGECLHAVRLEGRLIVEIPDWALAKDGSRRQAYRDWKAANPDVFDLKAKDTQRIKDMDSGMMADPKCRAILEAAGECEQSYFWVDAEIGLPRRARLDKLAEFDGVRIIGDIKATNIDVTDARQVGAKVLEFGYHRQGASYLDAVEAVDGEMPAGFGFMFVRNKVPYNARLWVLKPEDIDLGRRQNATAMIDLKRRLESGDWNENTTFGQENLIQLPKYAYADHPRNYDSAPYEEFANLNGECQA
jgi:PDDEXK-like domain of unknown function (DUF3799)